mgnify:CR=1 FL=1|tara:strand:- start:3692 stop:4594 length:903 start_codon:yes stop_codon:yes gene_type:complete
MAYSSGDLILDDHYNAFATSVNAIWGTGSGDAGYGNGTTVAAVSAGNTITAAQWTTLLARMNSMASHQGTSITSISNPSAGGTISAFTALSTNVGNITTARLTPAARQSVSNTNRDSTAAFTGTLTFTHKWAWGSANEARYFFNAGGRLSISGTQSGQTSDTKADNWESLLTAAGTYLITAQGSGKSGGSGSAGTNNTDYGYYDLTTTYVTVFKQLEDTSPYDANFVQWQLKSSDSGASVETSCTWVDSAADTSFNKSIYTAQDSVDGTHRMIFGFEKHNTTHVADNGGDITLSGTVGHS